MQSGDGVKAPTTFGLSLVASAFSVTQRHLHPGAFLPRRFFSAAWEGMETAGTWITMWGFCQVIGGGVTELCVPFS